MKNIVNKLKVEKQEHLIFIVLLFLFLFLFFRWL